MALLLQHGARCDLPDSDGRVALHWAAHGPTPAAVKLLLKAVRRGVG